MSVNPDPSTSFHTSTSNSSETMVSLSGDRWGYAPFNRLVLNGKVRGWCGAQLAGSAVVNRRDTQSHERLHLSRDGWPASPVPHPLRNQPARTAHHGFPPCHHSLG